MVIHGIEIDEFTHAYLRTALWAENDESDPETGGDPLDWNYDIGDFAASAIAKAAAECKAFQEQNAVHLAHENCLRYGPDFGPDGRAGHDFWLTRNYHGCRYWDGDWTDAAGEALTDAAHKAGSRNVYVGDDGKLYFDIG